MIRIEEAGYPVWIGTGSIDSVAPLLPRGRFFLVSDANVEAAGWAARLSAAIGDRLIGSFILSPGEESKSFRNLELLLDSMIEANVERSDHIVALGGGVVGDLAGFAAALLKRGCGFIPVPTTLLAQADAAIGGKTAVNARQGKNLIGAFHQPSAVLIDLATLATLPERELRAGYAEVVKCGLIGDAAFFAWCEANAAALLEGDDRAQHYAVETSVRAKIRLVADDFRDTKGLRALLNFGHTFGHAIEAETALHHGEAVAIGMMLALRFSVERGICPAAESARAAAHLASAGLPTRLEGVAAAAVVRRMVQDKKAAGGGIRLVLARGIGRAFLADPIALAEIERFLAGELSSARVAAG